MYRMGQFGDQIEDEVVFLFFSLNDILSGTIASLITLLILIMYSIGLEHADVV